MGDPYAVLGVSRSVDAAGLRRAYRSLVQQWHPDRHQGSQASHRHFLALQEAYGLLSDSVRRAAWDAQESERRQKTASTAAFEQTGAWSGWGDQVRAWWNDRQRPSVLAPPGDDATLELRVPLASIFQGGIHDVSARIAQACSTCRGVQPRCPRCGGTGQVLVFKTWSVTVPPAMGDGAIIQLREAGHQGPRFGRPGNVRIVVRWTKAGLWRWRAGRIEGQVLLSARRAQKGSRYALKVPSGKSGWITLKPGFKDGDWLALPGQGFDAEGRVAPAWIQIRVRSARVWKK